MSSKTSFMQDFQLRGAQTAEETWSSLESGIRDIFSRKTIATKRYMEMYNNIYHYCTSNNISMPSHLFRHQDSRGFNFGSELVGGFLYGKLHGFLKSHLQTVTDNGKHYLDEALLAYYQRNWGEFTFSSNVIHHLFLYLNRHWVRREQEDSKKAVYEIYSLALVTWRDTVLNSLESVVSLAVIKLIRRERNGDTINTMYITCVTHSYIDMGVSPTGRGSRSLEFYEKNLEGPLIRETRQYYHQESSEFLRQNPLSEYLKKALVRLTQEKERVERYLHETTMKRLITECEDVLIRFHLPQFYEEFKTFLNKDRDEDMGNMFQLALRVEHGLLEMQRLMEVHVTKQGLDAITAVVDEALNEPRVYVQTLLKVYTKYKALVMTAFENHPLFVAALDKACATFVNKNAVTEKANQARKSPELLARYCDFLLKKSSKVAEDDELEDILANIMIVFRYIDSKDVFQKFYSNMLAKRLVEHLSMSDDAEASMISKLKETCGALYTSKLQKMFQDVTVNVDLNTRFRQHVKQSGSALEVDFSVEVLTHGSWPFTQMPLFALPAELETCMDRFKLFYIHQHSGRKLIWLYHKSRAEIISNCFKRRYTMISSMYQVAVLLQYNHNTSYTLQQLQENTNINISDLQQVVRTLLKIRLLLCDNATSDDEVDLPLTAILDLYQDYSNKKLRININVALKSTEKKELEATHQNVDEERRHLIEAAVIRIMKTKKTLKHGELIVEVMKQLSTRFKAESKSIKKCIDGLIEREYLSRSAESANIYNYVA